MFLLKANTVIQVEVPKSQKWYHWGGWQPYTTKEDKLYDKHEVWDIVAINNNREDIPLWAQRNITEFNKIILRRAGKYAMVNAKDLQYLD